MPKDNSYTFQAKFECYKRITVEADSTQEAMNIAVDSDAEEWEEICFLEMQHPLFWDCDGLMVMPHEDKSSSVIE